MVSKTSRWRRRDHHYAPFHQCGGRCCDCRQRLAREVHKAFMDRFFAGLRSSVVARDTRRHSKQASPQARIRRTMNFIIALIVGLLLIQAFSGCEKADYETDGVPSPVASPSPQSISESNIERRTEKSSESSGATPTPRDQFRRAGRAKGATPLPTEQPSKPKPYE